MAAVVALSGLLHRASNYVWVVRPLAHGGLGRMRRKRGVKRELFLPLHSKMKAGVNDVYHPTKAKKLA